MGKAKKKTITLLLSLLILAVFIGIYFQLEKNNKEKEEQEQVIDSILLSNEEAASVVRLAYKNSSGNMVLVKKDNVWQKDGDEAFPVNQVYAQNMASMAANINASRKVTENAENLTEYGLEEPEETIEAELEDGSAIRIAIGDVIPGGSGRYANLIGENAVYIISESLYTEFARTEQEMIEMEETPQITEDAIASIEVIKQDKTVYKLAKEEEKEESDYYSWNITEAYPDEISADTSKLTEILPYFAGYTWLQCADYKPEDLSAYGLEKPQAEIKVVYEKEQEIENTEDETGASAPQEKNYAASTLLIGTKDKNGDYFAKTKEGTRIYTLAADSVDNMLNIKPYDLVLKMLSLTSIDMTDSVTVITNDKEYELSIKEEEKKDEIVSRYYCNQKEIPEDEFKAVYEAIISLQHKKELPNKDRNQPGEPVLTISFDRKSGDKEEISFSSYDNNYYKVTSHGKTYFLIDKNDIDNLKKTIAENLKE